MARKPSTKSKPKSPADAPASSAPETKTEHVESPLGAREHLFRVAKGVAKLGGRADAREQELWAIVEDQFIPAHDRILNRYNRRADEMLCQLLERDERFIEAAALARGEAF